MFNYSFNGRGISSVLLSVTIELLTPRQHRNQILKLCMFFTVHMHTQYVYIHRLVSVLMWICVHNLNMYV